MLSLLLLVGVIVLLFYGFSKFSKAKNTADPLIWIVGSALSLWIYWPSMSAGNGPPFTLCEFNVLLGIAFGNWAGRRQALRK